MPIWRVFLQCRPPGSFFKISPAAPVALQEIVGFFWTPTSGSIVREIARWQSFPDVDQWVYDTPSGFDHIGALEQSGVANHAVMQKPLIAGARLNTEVVRVLEIHIHRTQPHD